MGVKAHPPPWKTKVEGGDEETWVPKKRAGFTPLGIMLFLPFPPSFGKGSEVKPAGWYLVSASISPPSNGRRVSPAWEDAQCELYLWDSPSRTVVRGGNGFYYIETKSKHTSLPRTTDPAGSLSPQGAGDSEGKLTRSP